MRVQNYESLHAGKGLANAAHQSRDIYAAMMKRMQYREEHRRLYSELNAIDIDGLVKTPSNLTCYLSVGNPPGESFYDVFWRLFKASGLTDPQVYNSCNMGRDTFWRIVNNKNAGINKKTVVQLCFGLKLSYEDSVILVEAAGFTLHAGIEFDHVIITYLKNRYYDVNDVNLSLADRKVPSSLFLLQKNRRSSKEE
jgi:hypothetical protein